MKRINRREFLKKTAAATVAGTAFGHMPGLAFSQGAGTAAPFPDYKALVCVFLHGGNDAFNMLVPRSAAEYADYYQSRQNMAIAQPDLLPINPNTPDGADYGLHPSMTGIQGLFEQGRAAFINNVGPLVQPTTKADFLNQSVLLPPQLFSHNDQQDQWYSLKGATVTNTGWAGRIADLIRTRVAGQQLATNISLFGSTLFQSANETIPYVMGNSGPIAFTGFANADDLNDPDLTAEERRLIQVFVDQRNGFESVINQNYGSIYERGFADVQRRALSSVDLVNDALENAFAFTTPFPDTPLGDQLLTVARMISVQDTLQMERQIFFVELGGFDTHDDQLQNQPVLLGDLSRAMTAFYNATAEIGMADSVSSFTQSDFGRTLTSNGDGTDHAWGGIQLVIGDAVQGRDLYGTFPDLALGSEYDVGGGRFIPTTSADQYAATLARWFGVDELDIATVAPNIGNFQQQDLGFFI